MLFQGIARYDFPYLPLDGSNGGASVAYIAAASIFKKFEKLSKSLKVEN